MKQNSILTFCEALCVALLFAGMLMSAILSMSINATKNSKKELEIENQKKLKTQIIDLLYMHLLLKRLKVENL